MGNSLNPTVRQQIEWMVKHLCAEFDGAFDRARIAEVMDDSVEQLVKGATVFDYVPLMAYRFTRERLTAIMRTETHDAEGARDVVFVSLSGGGRGQIAAALTTLLSDDRVSVHSAGTAVQGQIDPDVRAVIAELGVDPDQAFARPLKEEVLHGADVIVTMGHSVGVIDLPEGVRHEDWRVGDPIGAPIAEIRRVRADIEHRVRTLLSDLGVPSADRHATNAARPERDTAAVPR
jgi:arsenate reductase (thioredoxin)